METYYSVYNNGRWVRDFGTRFEAQEYINTYSLEFAEILPVTF